LMKKIFLVLIYSTTCNGNEITATAQTSVFSHFKNDAWGRISSCFYYFHIDERAPL